MFAAHGRAGQPILRLLIASALLVTIVTVVALAQTNGTPVEAAAVTPEVTTGGSTIDPNTGALPTFRDLFLYSPTINGIILLLSLMSLAWFLFLIVTINPGQMAPASLTDEVTKLALRRKFESISDLCRAQRRTFIASIYQRLADNAHKDHDTLMQIIDTEGKRRADLVWNRISYLSDIANVAPMLGLLGTVLGMIKAFFLLEGQVGSVDSLVLSRGVGEAMATTMFGLVVAIITLLFYSIIKARATTTLAEAEAAVQSVADHMTRKPDSPAEEA